MSGTIICYGDSNTYGFDPTSFFGDRYPKNSRWPEIIGQETGFNVMNAGTNGREVPYPKSRANAVRECVERHIKTFGQLGVWIMLGVNDLLSGRTAAETAKRMEAFIAVLKSSGYLPEMDICLISPPPVRYGAWVDSEHVYNESRKLETEYATVAENAGVSFIGTGGWDIQVAFDGVHFTEEGHRKFAEKLISEKIV